MESCVMSPKLHIKIFGISISAEGVAGIVATVLIVASILLFYRF
jgi:hypothetical protein